MQACNTLNLTQERNLYMLSWNFHEFQRVLLIHAFYKCILETDLNFLVSICKDNLYQAILAWLPFNKYGCSVFLTTFNENKSRNNWQKLIFTSVQKSIETIKPSRLNCSRQNVINHRDILHAIPTTIKTT